MLAREIAATHPRRLHDTLLRMRTQLMTFARTDAAVTAALFLAIASLIAIALMY